ncbi:hypothetical protein D779_3317 [Imhoffiella purpurea]|uniref:Uncharacterized protein n=1 Tax=Imhoffiella purpurea TaxID=1249627 RepID=W9V2Q2_9GAMM|nr:hypothetical protein D779_3317 [Imhoffiella purpurea]
MIAVLATILVEWHRSFLNQTSGGQRREAHRASSVENQNRPPTGSISNRLAADGEIRVNGASSI